MLMRCAANGATISVTLQSIGGNKMGTGVSETLKLTQSASDRRELCAIVAKKASALKSAPAEYLNVTDNIDVAELKTSRLIFISV